MKRDMDLVRDILLALEERGNGRLAPVEIDIAGRSRAEIAYHVMITAQAGLVDAVDLSSPGRLDWLARNLTWEGHEFLDTSRNETSWERAKTIVFKQTGGLSIHFLQKTLTRLGQDALGI